jgi:ethanolamine ammonia-lyase small subunit
VDIEQIVETVLAKIQQQGRLPTELAEAKEFRVPASSVDTPHDARIIEHARSITPARIGIGHTGTRMKTAHYLHFRVDHAAAQDAVYKEVNEALLQRLQLPILHSNAKELKQYLMDLQAGRTLDEASISWMKEHLKKQVDVQIVVSNGLSSAAIEANLESILPALLQGLQLKNISTNPPIYVKRARVWVQDEIAKLVDCKLAVILIGERPGLNTAESMSAYLIYRPNEKTVEADRTVISNIHEAGLAPVEAGAYLSELIAQMLLLECTGVTFMRKKQATNS